MTGIERLRGLANGIMPTFMVCGVTMTSYDREHEEESWIRLRDFLSDIADQIEREQRRDPAADVSVSAYDLLPPDEREAIAWVRKRGGIAKVKEEWNHSRNLKRSLETAQAKVERQQRHIEFVQRKCRERQEHICELNKLKRAYVDALNGVCKRLGLTDGTGLPDMPEVIWAELDRRLMPEGMEWLVEAWPRFEDGEPVRFGEEAMGFTHKPPFVVDHITIFAGGEATVCAEADDDSGKVENFVRVFPGERVKRPAKVLDADGMEIELGDDLYSVEGSLKFHVSHVDRINGKIATDAMFSLDKWADPAMYTHRAPVLAADGKPLREGETAYLVGFGTPVEVRTIFSDDVVDCVKPDTGEDAGHLAARDLTHERPDSWERWREEWRWPPVKYCKLILDVEYDHDTQLNEAFDAQGEDLVRRAKKLAGDA